MTGKINGFKGPYRYLSNFVAWSTYMGTAISVVPAEASK